MCIKNAGPHLGSIINYFEFFNLKLLSSPDGKVDFLYLFYQSILSSYIIIKSPSI